jgi:hypothetical protein
MHLPPFELCHICNDYVYKTETYSQCAKKHNCNRPANTCALKEYFSATHSMQKTDQQYHSRIKINPFTYY